MDNTNEKKLLDLDDITSTEDLLTYFSQYMPSGNYETESLYEKLQKKTLTHRNLWFRFGTSREEHGGRRYTPYVYTEQGVSMLLGVLKSKIAVQES